MFKIKLANNNEYEVLQDTIVYPSNNPSIRSYMEIRIDPETMEKSQFESLLTNNELTKEIHIINTENPQAGGDITYTNYTIVREIGLKYVDYYDVTSGKNNSLPRLFCVLEQLTYIEQQLEALGINV